MTLYNNSYLMHYGVKGMKWGVRRRARKDAKEYARAKMYYGQGAGTRRKLIKATVDERSKDPDYKKAFDEALSKQNMSKHVSAAKRERTINTAKDKTVKFGRGMVNSILHTGAPVAASAAVTYTALHSTGLDKKITAYVRDAVTDFANTQSYKKDARNMFR